MKNIAQKFLALILLYSSIALSYDLPDLGERSETYISPQKERQLGKEFMKEIRLRLPILSDHIVECYIQNLGNRLSNAANNKKPLNLFVVNSPSINAFAGPNGNIGINTGTIEAAENESELAAVIAHEIAHISQHHIERLLRHAKNVQLTTLAGAVAAIIVGSSTNSMGNVATGGLMATYGGAAQNIINFTRKHESEADNIAMRILYNSSFDPHAMPRFFGRMQQLNYNDKNSVPIILQNHPQFTDRIAESKNRAERYPTKKIASTNRFYLIKTRIKVINSNNISRTIADFKNKLRKNEDDIGLQYGYAFALLLGGHLDKSEKITTKLQQKYPDETIIQMLAAKLSFEKKQISNSLNILKACLAKDKDYIPLIIQYGDTLIKAKKIKEACIFIRKKSRKFPNNRHLQRILAKAYALNGQKSYAYQAKAKAYEIDGYYSQAVILLRQALKTLKLNANDRAIINAKIDNLKKSEKN